MLQSRVHCQAGGSTFVPVDAHAPSRPYGGVSARDRIAGRRRQLLHAGLELFGTSGFTNARVKDVCALAGLSTRYFYESHRDLRALFQEVHAQAVDALYTRVTAAVRNSDAAPRKVLQAAVGAFVSALVEDPRLARIVFTEPAAVGPDALAQARAALRRFTDLVTAVARANLPAAVDEAAIQLFAVSVVGTLDHVIAEWLDGSLALTTEELVDACAAQFETLFAHLATEASRTRSAL
jgi:AcrR family transcriptional regulator